MSIRQTETLPTVDPARLEQAYERCAHLFEVKQTDESVCATEILETLGESHPDLPRDEIVDLFRRLCLTVQLVGDIDANWTGNGFSGERPRRLPSALYEIAGTETAFEETDDGYANTFFVRDVLIDAFAVLRPN